MGFHLHHYRRVGGFAALASGADVDQVDACAAPTPTTCHDAHGKEILRDRDGFGSDSAPGGLEKRIGGKACSAWESVRRPADGVS